MKKSREPNMFWQTANFVTQKALEDGALLPIATEAITIAENGVNYLVHTLSANAQSKPIATPQRSPLDKIPANPFLPYEPALYVAEAGDHHVCLLNKFPVLSPHLLICSKTFVPQSALLERSDFAAWLLGLKSDSSLGFFNSGPDAGASQTHRHMQLVQTGIPLESVIASGELPFKHCLYLFETEQDAGYLYQCYLDAVDRLEMSQHVGKECEPYNLLLTKRWMLVLPRSRNNIEGVFANGFNFTGRFLVKRPEQLAWLTKYGLMNYLKDCVERQEG
ncbi:phosphorylase [Photobacterium sanctipauli]|uniref:phosphorylase n=1 Tax=Photobacterium sanctipauli TaxID=1342794 RepID=UPI0023B82C13|nr:phosphorylase [Photobacterium sanctipauli]